jgi:hypothetical protein
MSAIQPIPLIVEKFGNDIPEITAAFRPANDGFGRRTGWIDASVVTRLAVSRTTLRQLKDQGFTKVRVQGTDGFQTVLIVEELLNG